MHILVVEHEPDVVDLFSKAIQYVGHTPVACRTLDEASHYLRNPANAADIMYLDNHFPATSGGGFGVYRIDEYLRLRPDIELVITTNQHLSPDLVDVVIQSKVGFLVKPTGGPRRIEADVAQRVARVLKERERANELIRRIKEAADSGREGFWRLLPFLKRPATKGREFALLSLEPSQQTVVIPGFERFCTVHLGQKIERHQTRAVECDIEQSIKASSEFGIGLGLEESAPFFATALGMDIKAKLTAEGVIKKGAVLRTTLEERQEITLTDADCDKDIAKREFFWGCEFAVWTAKIAVQCPECAMQETLTIRVFVPSGITEVSAEFDKAGRLVRDGRNSHEVIVPRRICDSNPADPATKKA